MTSPLKAFVDFLDSEKEVRSGLREMPIISRFVRPSDRSTYAPRLARSYVIGIRTMVLEQGYAEIWSVGGLVNQGGEGVAFKPAAGLPEDIKSHKLLFPQLAKQFPILDVPVVPTHNAIAILESIGTVVLARDPQLEKLRSEQQTDGAMELIAEAFGAALHDQLCRLIPTEIETIGTFVPLEDGPSVEFTPDEHLIDMVAGRAERSRYQGKTFTSVGPSFMERGAAREFDQPKQTLERMVLDRLKKSSN